MSGLRYQLGMNDPRIRNYWAMIVDSFGDNEQTMIGVLNIEMLQEKYQNVDIEFDI
ncbi:MULTISPECIES: hypothetical protein [unclassified Paenibacillus]|uniref:hypothetical protein n=1 Tax=unclassified Paenibacillus TaxID=185978 RepID=UPI00362D7603